MTFPKDKFDSLEEFVAPSLASVWQSKATPECESNSNKST